MENLTRKKFNEYKQELARLNGVSSASESFAVEPAVQQKLETRIQESSDFLRRINVVGVRDLIGEKVGMGISTTIAGRTDVTKRDRRPRQAHELNENEYRCESTEMDTAVTWAELDAWAAQPNFKQRLRQAIIQRQALDRIMIGFNGTHAAVESDRDKNPLLQDVNIGWLEHYRRSAASRVYSGGTVGDDGDFNNLDALVYAAINELIDPWHRADTALVAIVGRALMTDKYFPLINNFPEPTEKRATDLIISQQRMGGQQAIQVPFVPDNAILITTLSNLSIYYQKQARRSYIVDKPERKRIENYDSSNDAYVVEDFGRGCLIENIELKGSQKPSAISVPVSKPTTPTTPEKHETSTDDGKDGQSSNEKDGSE
ncbi:phage major capsid protein, P2 family [Carnimonas bestiolae]|uniref:phage major capsid protein, P2 family n=1 Tax=Carnimonas bestiolae TaxID=3402172 RepID=UPI003EDC8495